MTKVEYIKHLAVQAVKANERLEKQLEKAKKQKNWVKWCEVEKKDPQAGKDAWLS
jgi:hypothetical protein